jgi:uncharacterized protein YegJ (DUF2314 family)
MAQIYFVADKDPEMQHAIERARETFRYFWRELAWEHRRIIPGLSLAAVKVPFSDPPAIQRDKEEPAVEQMWLNEIEFDGKLITGTLLNSPHWLKSIEEGDHSQVPINGISDWMYAIRDRVYGAYTVNLLRSRMGRGERKQHDAAWGLDFGDPNQIQVVPLEWFGNKPKAGFFQRMFGGGGDEAPPVDLETAEHPMAVNMADSLREYLAEDPMNVYATDDNGWTMLHQQSLAGTAIGVSILLEHGADPNAVTYDGATPLQLAQSLGWKQVVDVLISHGAE